MGPDVAASPYAQLPSPPRWGGRPTHSRARGIAIRLLIAANLGLGFYYLSWRYLDSINWAFWPIALALVIAESYAYVEAWLFGLTVWKARERPDPPPPPEGATVDVFITCYNEPVELVRQTVRAARAIRYPHETHVLDDGNSSAMRAMAEAEGAGYIVRTIDWIDRPRHAKAGNLNNAILQTSGEFLLILDADQVPSPDFLDRTLGYFRDPRVAFVQTPQWFYNVPPGDPFGSQAPLFYGPIQQGKDGWNAAFFCGSNAVLRREALMQIGIANYASELDRRVRAALGSADKLLRGAADEVARRGSPETAASRRFAAAIEELRGTVRTARADLRRGRPLQEITWAFQQRTREIGRLLVADDLARMKRDLREIPGLDTDEIGGALSEVLGDEDALDHLTNRVNTPLASIEVVRRLLLAVDMDRDDEAIPVQPLSTVSVTEDMATAMRLHGAGWRSVYHDEILAKGLAPEDPRTMLQQRLRWAQGTIQVMLRENPLVACGLSLGQRLMYFATMWTYLSGVFAVVFISAPILYQFFGWLPVRAYSSTFFAHFLPYFVVNQLLFLAVGWGRPTWRGQQFSLALFPLWIQAVTSAAGNVWFGRKLGFVVTPKTRQTGVSYRLIRVQLVTMALLVVATGYGLARLLAGATDDWLPVMVNAVWALYSVVAIGAVWTAVRYRPHDAVESSPAAGIAQASGRARASAR